MRDREACERRVYRLATLLTGDRVASVSVIEAILAVQPALEELDGAHMDRLTVLRSREVRPAILFGTDVHAPTAEALARLDPQQREAWVFARVFRMPPREVARAMDCSTTAAQRHLDRAVESMHQDLGNAADGAAERLRAFVVGLDIPPLLRLRRLKQRRMRLAVRWAIVAALLAAILAVGGLLVLWLQAEGRIQ